MKVVTIHGHAWSEQFDSDDDASDHTTVNSASYDAQCASAYTTTEDAPITEPDSGNSSDTQSDNRHNVDEIRHEGPSDTYLGTHWYLHKIGTRTHTHRRAASTGKESSPPASRHATSATGPGVTPRAPTVRLRRASQPLTH